LGLVAPELGQSGPVVEFSDHVERSRASSRRAPAGITDGDDPDWASWYAAWLLDLSELPDVLGRRPVRSHLVHALVQLDRDYTLEEPEDRWEDWYAARLSAFLGE
jgi:hypothetical protein